MSLIATNPKEIAAEWAVKRPLVRALALPKRLPAAAPQAARGRAGHGLRRVRAAAGHRVRRRRRAAPAEVVAGARLMAVTRANESE